MSKSYSILLYIFLIHIIEIFMSILCWQDSSMLLYVAVVFLIFSTVFTV